MSVVNDEGYDPEAAALLEQDQPPDTSVAVLKRMDALETNVDVKQVLKIRLGTAVISF